MQIEKWAAQSGADRPQLGLVCQTSDDQIRFRTITRTQLLSLTPAARVDKLTALYRHNADRLAAAVVFCAAQGLRLYRMPSNLFPFSDTPDYASLLDDLAPRLAEIGRSAASAGLRLVMHPDQFVVLNSDQPSVIENARTVLVQHARLLDLMGQPQSPWAAINIHGGKAGRLDRLIAEIARLPLAVRSRLTLENDERAYGADEILQACLASGVAMVFDAHHHVIHAGLDSYDGADVGRALRAAAATWVDPGWQLTHISNGRAGFSDMAHSDFVSDMPRSFRDAPWIEIEAKAKEQAIARIQQGRAVG